MADKYIGDLANAEPNLTDYLVGVNGTDAYKALVSDVAKKVIETYAGTTLMGTAQSVKNAFNGSNSLISANNFVGANARQGWIALTSGQDLDDIKTVGMYVANTNTIAGSLVNSPTAHAFKLTVSYPLANNAYFRQDIEYTVAGEQYHWFRLFASTWGSWIFEPQRSEVNAIANSGAKNLIGGFPDSFVGAGVTFTKNSDGSITANGTSTATSITSSSTITLPAGSYILSGCPSGGATNTYNLGVFINGSLHGTRDNGSGMTFTLSSNSTILVRCYVYAAQGAVSNLTFYPMLRNASIIDDTYVPYGMSNAELTEKIPQFSQSQGQALGSSTTTITLTTGAYLLTLYHMGNDVNGLYLINVYSGTSGSRRVVPILANANMEITESAYTLSIKNNSANNANYSLLKLGDRM